MTRCIYRCSQDEKSEEGNQRHEGTSRGNDPGKWSSNAKRIVWEDLLRVYPSLFIVEFGDVEGDKQANVYVESLTYS